jgi:hypothetical protein
MIKFVGSSNVNLYTNAVLFLLLKQRAFAGPLCFIFLETLLRRGEEIG